MDLTAHTNVDSMSASKQEPGTQKEEAEETLAGLMPPTEVGGAAAPGAPKSTAADSAMQFEVAIMPDESQTGVDAFKHGVLKSLTKVLDKCGNVSNFLQRRHQCDKERQDFANSLHHLCRAGLPDWDVEEGKLPSSKVEAVQMSNCLKLPVAAFAFDPHCAVRSPPDNWHILELAESILNEGFITTTDPIMGMQSAEVLQGASLAHVQPPWSGNLLPFSVGFSKGRARIHTLLAILRVAFDNKLDIEQAGL